MRDLYLILYLILDAAARARYFCGNNRYESKTRFKPNKYGGKFIRTIVSALPRKL